MPNVKRTILRATVVAALSAVATFAFLSIGENNKMAADTTDRKEIKTDLANMDSYKKPSEKELKSKLTSEQFEVTQHEATERPFKNAYWDNHEAGIYVDVVSGEPLFSSQDKYDSGTGWPSFSKPLEPKNIALKSDRNIMLGERTEVRSQHADSHLGHVFDDGPAPTGKRYCMNSASLRFIPAAKLAEEGYGQYAELFGISDNGTDPKAKLAGTERVILAGGCFWGMQQILRGIPGIVQTRVGYSGGKVPNPTYERVSTGATGHAESVEIYFDPKKISFENLLGYFFRMHDPTTLNRQENDRGTQYRSAIFYTSEEQKATAEKVKEQVDKSGKWKHHLVTEITPASEFYEAESYHQDYLVKHPDGYTCHFLRD